MSVAAAEVAAKVIPTSWKIGGAVVLAAALVLGTAWITHRVDEGTIAKMKEDWAEAQTEAIDQAMKIQRAQDDVSLQAAVDEAASQQKIVTQTQIITKEVPIHVPAASKCPVTVGFLRVLDAAVLGSAAADLPLAAGQSDESCATTDARTLALNITANYSACRANAEQLGGLQSWVTGIIAASKLKKK